MRYEIRVKGMAAGDISDWFGEMQVRRFRRQGPLPRTCC